jgi:hypothetical protein
MMGAPGTMPLTVNVWLTCGAGRYVALPPWLALMVQLPAVRKVSCPPVVTVHTAMVLELKLTGRLEGLACAVSVGVVPKFCAPGLLKAIVCASCAVVLFDAADGAPVPAELVAVTVKV